MAKEKKQFTELSEEELKNVNGGFISVNGINAPNGASMIKVMEPDTIIDGVIDGIANGDNPAADIGYGIDSDRAEAVSFIKH